MTFTDWLIKRFDRTGGGAVPPRKGDVARAIGVRPATVTSWCKGAPPSAVHVAKLADALGLTEAERVEMLATLAAAKGAA